jgi:hypothetical protein
MKLLRRAVPALAVLVLLAAFAGSHAGAAPTEGAFRLEIGGLPAGR